MNHSIVSLFQSFVEMGNELSVNELTNAALQKTTIGDFAALKWRPNDWLDATWLFNTYTHALSEGIITRNDQWIHRKRTNLSLKKRHTESVLPIIHNDEWRRKQLKYLQRESWFWVSN